MRERERVELRVEMNGKLDRPDSQWNENRTWCYVSRISELVTYNGERQSMVESEQQVSRSYNRQ